MNLICLEDIIEKLQEIEKEYKMSQALILSESDFKCHLFRKLYTMLNHSQKTMDLNVSGSPLHTEIKFFDENGKLTLVPDITILSPKELSIFHSVSKFKITRNGIKYQTTSSKEFEFGGNSVIIELKFCKDKFGIRKNNLSSYIRDLDKILNIQKIVNISSNGENQVLGVFAVLNKTDNKVKEFDEFMTSNANHKRLKVFYGTGMVSSI
mgnify:CR=1 FL=1